MTVPFVTELRTPDEAVIIGGGNGNVLHLRVQSAELWDALRVDAPDSAPVAQVKTAALDKFFPDGYLATDFVVKLRGFEILNEDDALTAAGVRNGSTLLLSRRRRRPVK
ncbi:MAG TPA: hypothetical protein VF042_14890 [Gemmatimonadaceae bacterium]